MPRLVFSGYIAGLGTEAGVRMVIGSWAQSPFGTFADVMIETADGRRTLLAPTTAIAEFVSDTYRFDRIEIGNISAVHSDDGFILTGPGLDLSVQLGKPAPYNWLLRAVPRRIATAPTWLRVIDPIASRLLSGVRTAGTAGNHRREYYGVRRTRLITSIAGTYHGADLGGVAPLLPPVAFGFSSAPPTPQMVSVTTTIDVP